MNRWTHTTAAPCIEGFDRLDTAQRDALLAYLNRYYPPAVYERHRSARANAQRRAEALRREVATASAQYPPFIDKEQIHADADALSGCAVVITAGGDGERLKQSLVARGTPAEALTDYTKATFPLPGLPAASSTLELTLGMIADISRRSGIDIPVIVSTGPRGSTTARIIPHRIAAHDAFGLCDCTVIAQHARLHLTTDDKIAVHTTPQGPRPVTHPDETGGPLMRLKEPAGEDQTRSILTRLHERGITRLLIVQGTALYEPTLLYTLAHISRDHDAVGVGIRSRHKADIASLGTFVSLYKDGTHLLRILDPHHRDDTIDSLTDPTGTWYLPCNTGLYACHIDTLAHGALPDFCTSDKEILPHLPRAPKAGYAATDLMRLAHTPVVFVTEPESFAVIKTVEDLPRVAAAARRFALASARDA
jgi:hypothetical protein